MKKLAVLLAVVFVSGGIAKAGELENLRYSSDSLLSQIEDSIDGLSKAPPKPSHVKPGHNNPGHHPAPKPPHVNPGHNPGHNNPGHHPAPQPPHVNPGHNPGHHPVPPPPPPTPVHPPYNPHNPGWQPAPHPYPPYPPYYPPYPNHNDRVRFESAKFDWSGDARRSFEDAVEQLRERHYFILDKRMDYDRYTIVFESRRYVRIERYDSRYFAWSSDVRREADEKVHQLRRRGMIILEKNVKNYSFTIRYFDPR